MAEWGTKRLGSAVQRVTRVRSKEVLDAEEPAEGKRFANVQRRDGTAVNLRTDVEPGPGSELEYQRKLAEYMGQRHG